MSNTILDVYRCAKCHEKVLLEGVRGRRVKTTRGHECVDGKTGTLFWEGQYDATLSGVPVAGMEAVIVPTIRKGQVLVQFIPTRHDGLTLRVQENGAAVTGHSAFTTELIDEAEMKKEIEAAGGELGPA